MLVWLTLPFYDFCGFRSVAVNSVYKPQFFYIYSSMTEKGKNVMWRDSIHAVATDSRVGSVSPWLRVQLGRKLGASLRASCSSHLSVCESFRHCHNAGSARSQRNDDIYHTLPCINNVSVRRLTFYTYRRQPDEAPLLQRDRATTSVITEHRVNLLCPEFHNWDSD